MLYWWAMILVWPFFTIFFPTKVYGKKNLIKGKCIWACNHQSNNDIFVLATKLFARVYILGKKELFKNKFVGGFLKKLGGIPVSRGEADITASKKKTSHLSFFHQGQENLHQMKLKISKAVLQCLQQRRIQKLCLWCLNASQGYLGQTD